VEKVTSGVNVSCEVIANSAEEYRVTSKNTYLVECFAPDGALKWAEENCNLVTEEGLDDLLGQYFKGSGYTAAFYVGLVDNASFSSVNATNTASNISVTTATNGWIEFDDYSEAVRQTLSLGAVASQSVDNSASKATFSIDATGTVNGAFIATTNTIGGTSGVLYGVVSFASTRAVTSGDTLNITVTLTQASA